jgi:hypothetical protein
VDLLLGRVEAQVTHIQRRRILELVVKTKAPLSSHLPLLATISVSVCAGFASSLAILVSLALAVLYGDDVSCSCCY